MVIKGLKEEHNICHVTIYHGAYKQEDLKEIFKKVQAIVSKKQSPLMDFARMLCTTDGVNAEARWIDIETKKTDEILSLHKKVVETCSPYHQRPLERVSDIYDRLPETKKKMVDEFGVTGVNDSHWPHTTLWYQYPPKDELKGAAAEAGMGQKAFKFTCHAFGVLVGLLGFNGNIVKPLKFFKFADAAEVSEAAFEANTHAQEGQGIQDEAAVLTGITQDYGWGFDSDNE